MKNVIRVLWIVKNFFFFLKSLSRYNHFNWDNSACRSINSTIDSTSMVHGSYMLNNVSIGYASYISTNALMANTNVGRFCSIGPNVVSGMGIHPINGISTHPAFYSKKKKSKITLSSVDLIKEHLPVTIGNDVFIGANVTILDGISIGDGAVIGAGAVVSKNIPPYAVAVGCPIKIVKYRFSPEVIEGLINSEWWNDSELIKDIPKSFFDVEQFAYSKLVFNKNS